MEPESHVGRRVRELRAVRGLSQRALAGMAGMSQSNLSNIERGLQVAERKATLEALAAALRVAPSDLMGQPFAPTSSGEVEGHAAVEALRGVIRDISLGAVDPGFGAPDVDGNGTLREDIARAERLKSAADYGALGVLVPALVARAHLLTSTSAEARLMLVRVLICALRLTRNLGYNDVAWSVAEQLHRAASAAGDPAWIGIANFQLSDAMVGTDARSRALAHVERAANDLAPGAGPEGEAYGMLRLSAALQSAILGNFPAAYALIDEAADVARYTGNGSFAGQAFGPRNVALWRVEVAVEAGDFDTVGELSRGIHIEEVQSLNRKASFYINLGRGLAARRSQDTAIEAFRLAEDVAPQHVHANPYVRETVLEMLRRSRRDAGGVELRGMAYRMGIGA